MNPDEVKCPKCKSFNFEFIDSDNYYLYEDCDEHFKCLECDCEWLQGSFKQYTDDVDIIKKD